MGTSKPLLNFNGVTILERMVSAFRCAGLPRIRVIGRKEDHELAEATLAAGAAFVVNPRPDLEMAGSILIAIENCDAPWMAVCPTDMPLLSAATIAACVDALEGDVVQPSTDGRPKHPVFLHKRRFPGLKARLHEGYTLRDCLSEIEAITRVPSDNPMQFKDVDTPEDVEALLRGLR
jgi:CTP:molybdopterin cytidylyltransferase MocA